MTHDPDDLLSEISSSREDFFKAKRPWSKIKDRILASYMSPYTAKIVRRGQPLLFIDAFAGPGKMETGEPGSPLIICQAAEKFARGQYQALFFNIEKEHHLQLTNILEKAGWSPSATAIHGDGTQILQFIVPLLTSQSVFLYIDPFGLECEFDVLEPFLERNSQFSTEILINLHMTPIHRLASRQKVIDGTGDMESIAKFHDKLTRTLGGEYWKDILLNPDETIDPKTREEQLVAQYQRRLSSTNYLTYTGSCPIRESRDSVTKYYMIFASPHPDAMTLFNDNMCAAFNTYHHEKEIADTFFAGQHWTTWRDNKVIENLIVEYVEKHPQNSRKRLWLYIVLENFMLFTSSEYKKAVTRLVEQGRIICSTPVKSTLRPTKKLNDNCILEPISK